jgi:protein-L-isoaspartate(D-aspartate) O-methyltransferase
MQLRTRVRLVDRGKAMTTFRVFVAMLAVFASVSLCTWAAYAQQTDPFASARTRMIEHHLKGRDINDPAVLRAMTDVPRHRFVPSALQPLAYADRPLPIGHGQTISQPYIVALMTQMLEVRPSDRVLEIGTGCGYQAAVLALLSDKVYTIEIVEPLARKSQKLLVELGYKNVFMKAGDGFDGWPEYAPFDKIILTCAVKEIPLALITQLAEGGQIIAPLGSPGSVQELVLATKEKGKLKQKKLLSVRFVPMTGRALENR